MIKAFLPLLLAIAVPAFAQQTPSVGAADPSLAQRAEQSRLQAIAQARAQAAARARFQADLTLPSPTAPADPGRTRPIQDQSDLAPSRTVPSPYGSYYRIHTPWDPQ